MKDGKKDPSRPADELTMAKERLELTQLAGGITSWEWDLETDQMTWTAGRSNLVRLGAQETLKFEAVVNAAFLKKG